MALKTELTHRVEALTARARRSWSHPQAKQIRHVLSWFREPLIALVLVFAATTAIAEPFYVPSGSMEPTLDIGDAIIAAKYAYGYSHYSVRWGLAPDIQGRLFGSMPKRGDVVVFHPTSHPNQVWVKRVVGLPGDHLQMIHGRLWINGKELPLKADGTGRLETESGAYIRVAKFIETLPNGVKHPIYKMRWNGPLNNTKVYVVPKGDLFMMGDNRDDSLDSRVPARDGGVGYVPLENVIGQTDLVVGSYDFLNPGRGFGAFRLSRLFHVVH